MREYKPIKIQDEALKKDVELYPDAYQHERAERFNCTTAGICIALKRLGITQKKDSKSSNKQRRDNFTAELIHYNRQKRPIIYLDESGFKSHDYRPYGYSKRGITSV